MHLLSESILPPAKPDGVCLLVHGGAWAIPFDESEAHREGMRQALAWW